MTPTGITYCEASMDGRCVNIECRRFLTRSMIAAAERDRAMLSIADMSTDCKIKRAPR